MTTATVVVADLDGPAGPARQVIQGWVALGLIEEPFWVASNDCMGLEDHAQARTLTVRIGDETDSLFEALSVSAPTAIRLVNLAFVNGRVAPEALLVASGMQRVLRRTAGQRLLFQTPVNLLVTDSTCPTAVLSLLLPNWHNIVVSPEDRRHYKDIDRLVAGDALAAHAALALSCVGALWRQQHDTPFDREVPAGNDPVVVVTRSFVHALDGGMLANDLLDRLVLTRPAWPAPHSNRGKKAATVPDRWIAADLVARQFAGIDEGETLHYRGLEPPAPPTMVVIRWWAAITQLVKAIWGRLRRRPSEWVTEQKKLMLDRVEAIAQKVTYADDSEYKVVVRLRPDNENLSVSELVTMQSEDLARQIRRRIVAPETPAACPALWQSLLAVGCSLIDAGPMPKVIAEPPMDGTERAIISRPDAVVAAPGDNAMPLPPDSIIERNDELAELLRSPVRACDPRKVGQVMRLVLRTAPIPSALPVAVAVDAGAGGTPGEPTAAESYVKALDEWTEPRRGSFVWLVGDGVSSELDEAQRDFERHLKTIEAGPALPDERAEEALRRRLRRSLIWRVLFGVVVVFVAAVLVIAALVAPVITLAVGLTLLLGLLVSYFWRYLQFLRELERLAHRRRLGISAFDFAIEAAQKAATEIVRLTCLYCWYLDWAEIIGWFVHEPWGQEEGAGAVPEGLDGSCEPEAFEPLKADIGDHDARALVAKISGGIFTTGWLGRQADAGILRSMAALEKDEGNDPEDAPPDPTVDTSLPGGTLGREEASGEFDLVTPPRTRLLADLRDRVVATDARSALKAIIAEECASLDLAVIYPRVRVLREPQHEPQATREVMTELIRPPAADLFFEVELFSPRGRTDNAHRVASSRIWAPASLGGRPADAPVTTAELRPEYGARFMPLVVRLDMSGELRPDELTIFPHESQLPDPGDEEPDVDEPPDYSVV